MIFTSSYKGDAGSNHTGSKMNINNLLSQGLMGNGKRQENNARFESLLDIHHDLQQRFIARVLGQLNDEDKLKLNPRIEKMANLKKHIADHIKTVGAGDLHQYAFCLKEAALLAMKLCQKYRVCNDIKTFNYNAVTRMIELNGEDLYFLGEAKHQNQASAAAVMQDKHTCNQCGSDKVVMVSELHRSEAINPAYAPPRKKLAFFGAFLSCSFLGIAWYLAGASMAGSGEPPYLYMFAGLACFVYTAYALHYNFMKFPSAIKQWQSSFCCNDCGSISVAKS